MPSDDNDDRVLRLISQLIWMMNLGSVAFGKTHPERGDIIVFTYVIFPVLGGTGVLISHMKTALVGLSYILSSPLGSSPLCNGAL